MIFKLKPLKRILALKQAANDEQTIGKRWFSMIRNDDELVFDAEGNQVCRCVDVKKAFTDKNGEDYQIA